MLQLKKRESARESIMQSKDLTGIHIEGHILQMEHLMVYGIVVYNTVVIIMLQYLNSNIK
jgi:hypothetical protein